MKKELDPTKQEDWEQAFYGKKKGRCCNQEQGVGHSEARVC